MIRHEQPAIDIDIRQAEQHLAGSPTARDRAVASLSILLSGESEDDARYRAMRRLARQGAALLPLALKTLHCSPEITTPPWPFWPSQYEVCGLLLSSLSRAARTPVGALLCHPAVSHPAGPVLWTSIIEAAGRVPPDDYETLLRDGLRAPWTSTRYAAAAALGNLAGSTTLSSLTITALHECLRDSCELPLRLASSHALLHHGDSRGVDALLSMLDAAQPALARKAAAFVLASESPLRAITTEQRARLEQETLRALVDPDGDIALYAADIVSGIATTSTLQQLRVAMSILTSQAQIAVLTALEGMAGDHALRTAIQRSELLVQAAGLLSSAIPEVRRQAACTLGATGGAYAAAVLAATLLKDDQAGRGEAVEGLRLLPDAMRPRRREQITRWLLYVLDAAAASGDEETQVIALDSLAYVSWLARRGGSVATYRALSEAIWRDETAPRLLISKSAWVRQRAVELLAPLAAAPSSFFPRLTRILHGDEDSGVRACVAYVFGQARERRALPALLLALLDPDECVAETALNALGRAAGPGNPVALYVLRELAGSCRRRGRAADQLARTARAILREWRVSNSREIM